jgi:hypothetical protein
MDVLCGIQVHPACIGFPYDLVYMASHVNFPLGGVMSPLKLLDFGVFPDFEFKKS